MTNQPTEQLYCSVDLEFTGFDPSRDQILEIGFAFFKLTETGFEVVEEWSQVFKSSIEVHPKILGLTGITQEELDNAPDFNEHREFLQSKLGNAIIVGHNPVMDVKFLEAYGIKLSGKVIDTLELVQFILPTHHSYNLENLVHYFGIKHHKAHRALGDALSTILVLENLVRVYQNFSNQLKKELAEVIARGDFLWSEVVNHQLNVKELERNDSLHSSSSEENLVALKLNDDLITIDDSPFNHEKRVSLGLKEKNEPVVLAVPDSGTVMRLWKEGYAHGVFESADTFSISAFESFLKTSETNEELRFALKIIVWLHTNWQTEVVFDLNISFFGGQFRESIVGGEPAKNNETVVAVDYSTLQTFSSQSKQSPISNRKLVICDIQNFEKLMSSGFGTRLGWGSALYALRSIYNPETGFGEVAYKDEVTSALVATDLFFGLVYMLLHQALPSNQYATLEELTTNHHHIYNRLKRAADNLRAKIDELITSTGAGDLLRVSRYLEDFFIEDDSRVKWIDIDERNLSFHDQPIDIAENVKTLLTAYEKVQFTDTISTKPLLSYLVDRLGLRTEVSEFPNKSIPSNLLVESDDKHLTDSQLNLLVHQSELPLVLVMAHPAEIKDFYNAHYSEIKEESALFAQGYSGGGNKMFRNFSIRENSILLVTADFMAKQNYLLTAKTIIFTSIPLIESGHPYTAALISHWNESHPDLLSVLSIAKVTAALKKLKLNDKVVVKMFGAKKNVFFVDNSY